jgi:hypothetical protein
VGYEWNTGRNYIGRLVDGKEVKWNQWKCYSWTDCDKARIIKEVAHLERRTSFKNSRETTNVM